MCSFILGVEKGFYARVSRLGSQWLELDLHFLSLGGGEIALGWWFEECLVPYLVNTQKLEAVQSISIVTGYGKTRLRGARQGDDGMRKRVRAMLKFMNIEETAQPNRGRVHIDKPKLITEVKRNGGRIVFDLEGYVQFKEDETTANKFPDVEQKVRPRYKPANPHHGGPPFIRIETESTSEEFRRGDTEQDIQGPPPPEVFEDRGGGRYPQDNHGRGGGRRYERDGRDEGRGGDRRGGEPCDRRNDRDGRFGGGRGGRGQYDSRNRRLSNNDGDRYRDGGGHRGSFDSRRGGRGGGRIDDGRDSRRGRYDERRFDDRRRSCGGDDGRRSEDYGRPDRRYDNRDQPRAPSNWEPPAAVNNTANDRSESEPQPNQDAPPAANSKEEPSAAPLAENTGEGEGVAKKRNSIQRGYSLEQPAKRARN